MQLIEIQEAKLHDKQNSDEIAIGIDFGTTNSLVAVVKDGKPYVIEMVPSIVGLDDKGALAVMSAGIRSVKRLLGKSIKDAFNKEVAESLLDQDGSLKVKIKDRVFSPIELSAVILSHLKAKAEEYLGKGVVKAVITVPAYFDDAARSAVALAARAAGLEVLRLINEPTAAALAYGLDNASEGAYLVYDFGGGTFDVSLLNMRMGVFQVLATGGDAMLGGDDIDHILQDKLGCSLAEARSIKEQLSSLEEAGGLSRTEFNDLIRPLIERTIDITTEVLASSDKQVKGIILVGGASRIPLVKQELIKNFSVEVFDNLDPDKIVALGASLQAENLVRPSGNLLIDVVSLSLGIELMGGINEKIILRNSPVPTAITKKFTTHADNQTAMQFHIVQGEREMAADCRSLARFELKNIPPMKAGLARIEVTFEVDVDGLVSISAKEELTGTTQIVEIKPTYGLNQAEAIEMLRSAYENAEEDHHKRQLEETIFKAENSINLMKQVLFESSDLLASEELDGINNIIAELKSTILERNRDNILQKLERLLKISDEFALRRLNQGVLAAFKGKHIDEVDGDN